MKRKERLLIKSINLIFHRQRKIIQNYLDAMNINTLKK